MAKPSETWHLASGIWHRIHGPGLMSGGRLLLTKFVLVVPLNRNNGQARPRLRFRLILIMNLARCVGVNNRRANMEVASPCRALKTYWPDTISRRAFSFLRLSQSFTRMSNVGLQMRSCF